MRFFYKCFLLVLVVLLHDATSPCKWFCCCSSESDQEDSIVEKKPKASQFPCHIWKRIGSYLLNPVDVFIARQVCHNSRVSLPPNDEFDVLPPILYRVQIAKKLIAEKIIGFEEARRLDKISNLLSDLNQTLDKLNSCQTKQKSQLVS